MSAPVFVAARESLQAGDHVLLDGPEGRHAVVVRRLRPGESVDLTDGAGLVVRGVVVSADAGRLEVAVRERVVTPEPQPRLAVVQALPKGDRGELAVELMTEVGVDEIVPWAASRSVAVWRGERGTKALGRWRTTAREAAKQARRPWHPDVSELAGTADVVERIRQAGLALVLHEGATEPVARVPVPPSGQVVLVVGPEGGLTDEEVETLSRAGARAVRLGPTVLRTSTAGVVAAAVLLAGTPRWAGPD